MDEITPMTRDEFIAQNPFGVICKMLEDGSRVPLNEEEYEEWVQGSKGIWQ